MKNKELSNASQYPKFYYAKHMYPGLCGYDDETILVDTDVMKSMLPSFNGKPIYVYHDERSIEERMLNLNDSAGYVVETFYNEVDGWAWSKIMITSDEGHDAISKGWAVSNAYLPEDWGEGGMKHNCSYDKKLLGAEFTHLAIVDNPRYEDACVLTPDEFKVYQEKEREQLNEMKNSKTKKGFTMNIFKKQKIKSSEIDADTIVEISNSNGKKVEISVQEMINAIEKQNAESKTFDVAGKKMTAKEIVKKFTEMQNKKNSDEEIDNDDDEVENEDDENQNDDDENQNSDEEHENDSDEENQNDDDEMENEDEDEKSNSKKNHFKELKNANKAKQKVQIIETAQNKIQRGKSRYGSAQ